MQLFIRLYLLDLWLVYNLPVSLPQAPHAGKTHQYHKDKRSLATIEDSSDSEQSGEEREGVCAGFRVTSGSQVRPQLLIQVLLA